jgi:hypothetical protein
MTIDWAKIRTIAIDQFYLPDQQWTQVLRSVNFIAQFVHIRKKSTLFWQSANFVHNQPSSFLGKSTLYPPRKERDLKFLWVMFY